MVELPNVRIERDSIYFDDQKLAGIIEQDGVTVYPGGASNINRLTVTFLVGKVEATDPTEDIKHFGGESVRIAK